MNSTHFHYNPKTHNALLVEQVRFVCHPNGSVKIETEPRLVTTQKRYIP